MRDDSEAVGLMWWNLFKQLVTVCEVEGPDEEEEIMDATL